MMMMMMMSMSWRKRWIWDDLINDCLQLFWQSTNLQGFPPGQELGRTGQPCASVWQQILLGESSESWSSSMFVWFIRLETKIWKIVTPYSWEHPFGQGTLGERRVSSTYWRLNIKLYSTVCDPWLLGFRGCSGWQVPPVIQESTASFCCQ